MVAKQDPPSSLAVLGLTAREEQLYRALLQMPGLARTAVPGVLGVDEVHAAEVVERLIALGLVGSTEDELVAAAPVRALARLADDEQHRLQGVSDRLAAVRALLPTLEAAHREARGPRGTPVQVEAISNHEVVATLRALVHESGGDLLWMRPDQWRVSEGRAADRLVRQLLREGRRSRALYPARVLEEAPHGVRQRAELGEQVRILGDVPGRLAVVGDVAALIPNRFDLTDDVVLIVRQPALVAAVTLLFESLWERALIVPGISGEDTSQRASARRLLLDQLARGTKDEQIARTLGLSLRTVRRRVAELMDELDAGSRFQAGVEAVRRGWL